MDSEFLCQNVIKTIKMTIIERIIYKIMEVFNLGTLDNMRKPKNRSTGRAD